MTNYKVIATAIALLTFASADASAASKTSKSVTTVIKTAMIGVGNTFIKANSAVTAPLKAASRLVPELKIPALLSRGITGYADFGTQLGNMMNDAEKKAAVN
jgi:hypothetical protein